MKEELRILVFKEGNTFLAQCLDFDVLAQADTENRVIFRLQLNLYAELNELHKRGWDGTGGLPIGVAPDKYWDIWEKRSCLITPPYTEHIPVIGFREVHIRREISVKR